MRPGTRRALVLGGGAAGAAALAAGLHLWLEASASGARAAPDDSAAVGLVASPLVVAVDRSGSVMPVDPANPVLDLPVLRVLTRRSASLWGLRVVARDVGRMAEMAPEVFAVVSEAQIGDREVSLVLGDSEVRLRYVPPISETRLRQGIVALNDALERLAEEHPREIDLRFDDQVVVRTR